jgi:hypothetical protein
MVLNRLHTKRVNENRIIYSGVGIFNWYYLSSPPQILRGPGVHLESPRLILHRTVGHCKVHTVHPASGLSFSTWHCTGKESAFTSHNSNRNLLDASTAVLYQRILYQHWYSSVSSTGSTSTCIILGTGTAQQLAVAPRCSWDGGGARNSVTRK